MTENDDIRRRLDRIDGQLCALLAERERIAGSSPAPDRRRLAAVRKIGQRFGENVAGAYRSILTGSYTASGENSARQDGADIRGAGKFIDITRELLGAEVFPGDTVPSMERLKSISEGELYNLSILSLGTHSGSHMDAPLHFIDGGADISEVAPGKYIGKCIVAGWGTFVTRGVPDGCSRLLIKNAREFTEEQAEYAAGSGLVLIGTEQLTVGSAKVHRTLLGKGIAVLENIDLSGTDEGEYFLFCAPLKISGADGAPCRAFLMSL